MPYRYDRIDIKGQVKKTDEGYLLASAPIARIGIYTYHLKDGTTRKELVDAETLSNVDSNNSLKLKPVTNNHPLERMVNSGNSKLRTVGSVGETIENKDGFLMANFIITDSDTVEAINKGRKQLSPGYKVQLEMTPGTFNGEHYDAIQRKRIYNHLAIVDNARGGDQLRLNIDHVDSDDGIVQDIFNQKKNKESRSMETYKIDGLPYEAAPEVVNHISKLTKNIDDLGKSLKDEKANTSKLEARADAAEEKVKELEKKDSKEAIANAVKARISLEKNSSKVLGEENFDGTTDEELMKKVIMKKCKSAKLDGKDSTYIQARYDGVIENLEDDSFTKQKEKTHSKEDKEDEEKIDSVAAHAAMVKRNRNMWQDDKEGVA